MGGALTPARMLLEELFAGHRNTWPLIFRFLGPWMTVWPRKGPEPHTLVIPHEWNPALSLCTMNPHFLS